MSYEVKRKNMSANAPRESHGIAQVRRVIAGTTRLLAIAKAKGQTETAKALGAELARFQEIRRETRGRRNDAANALRAYFESAGGGSKPSRAAGK